VQSQLFSRRALVLTVGAASASLITQSFSAAAIPVTSTKNWSGYYATAPTNETFNDVAGTFFAPTLTAPSSGSTYSTFWVGFDGASGMADPTVEQCGITATISAGGTAMYSAWYEFAPAAESIVNLTVYAGDKISADVSYEGNNAYQFTLDDLTTGQNYSSTQTTSTDQRSSAEWITEAPSLGSNVTTLSNYGSAHFATTDAALDYGSDQTIGALASDLTEDVMQQNNVLVSLPTTMASTDAGFYTTYEPTALTWYNKGAPQPSDGVTWDVLGNNNWNGASAPAAYADGDAVTFNDTNNSHYAVTLNSTVQPASVTVNSTGNYTISGSGAIDGSGSLTKSGAGTLTLGTANGYTGGTFVTAGKLIIDPTGSTNSALPKGTLSISGSGVVQLASNVTQGSQSSNVPVSAPTSNVILTSLLIGSSATLDITNNHILVDYSGSDPISTIANLITKGFNTGNWGGTGITSTTAQSNAGSYGIGYADAADAGNPAGLSAGQIEIMYTLLGDANLDGKVNGADFTLMAANFNDSVAHGWDKGDFNYDGAVNGSDFVLLANDFNHYATQSAVDAQDLAALDSFAASNGISLATVPEPVSGAIFTLAAIAALSRRRRSIPKT
jgi:autotransporter-associated beta strand protein